MLKKEDLPLRDLGYFVLEVLQQITEKKAYSILRLRCGTMLHDDRGRMKNCRIYAREGIVDRYVRIGLKNKSHAKRCLCSFLKAAIFL